jgi:hypothetical protein
VLELITASSSSDGGGLSGFSSVGGNLDVAAATNMGLTYVMLGFFYASFIQFPLGYLLLQRKPEAHSQQQQQKQDLLLQPAAAVCAASPASTAAAQLVAQVNPAQQDRALLPAQQQQQLSPQQQQLQSAQQQQLQLSQQPHLPQQSQQGQVLMVLRGVFTPPVLACLLAVPVASLPALRSALFSPGGERGVLLFTEPSVRHGVPLFTEPSVRHGVSMFTEPSVRHGVSLFTEPSVTYVRTPARLECCVWCVTAVHLPRLTTPLLLGLANSGRQWRVIRHLAQNCPAWAYGTHARQASLLVCLPCLQPSACHEDSQ